MTATTNLLRRLGVCEGLNGTTLGYLATAADTYGFAVCNKNGTMTFELTGEYEAGNAIGESKYFHDMDVIWFTVCASFVFLMQAGFSMLEAGSVSSKNTIKILFKNLLDACIGAIFYYGIGSGLAKGSPSNYGFVGTPFGHRPSNFEYSDGGEGSGTLFYTEFFAFSFAATAATIVSGSVAERSNLIAYFIYALAITVFIYPVVVHWVWNEEGFLYKMGFVDFAGSGVVHIVGGFSGLVGAVCVGPRTGRFTKEGVANPMPGHSMVMCSLGVMILWFGWYGFNCGSTLGAKGSMDLAGRVAVTTTLAAATASFTATFYIKITSKHFDLAVALNAVIAGLVSITAGCATMDTYSACATGAIGAMVYIFASKLMLKLQIDDPLEASPIHGFCGMWGVLAAGIFGTIDEKSLIEGGYSIPTENGGLLGVQFIGLCSIVAWTVATSMLVFVPLRRLKILRVPKMMEFAHSRKKITPGFGVVPE